MHNRLYIAHDYGSFKCSLNDISCFPYENVHQRIKKCVYNPITLQNKFQSGTLNISNVLDSYQRNNYLPKYQQKLKDNCFLLNDVSIAFVKVKHNDGTLEYDVIYQRYVDSLYKLQTDSKAFNVYLLASKNRKKMQKEFLE